jgi:quercetin dioxygenase-like cupin family protein
VEPQFIRLNEVRAYELAERVSARPLFGENAMLNLLELEPGAVVPVHSHPHEQLGVVLRGLLLLTVADVKHRLEAMAAFAIPGGIEHSAGCGPEGATVLDVFQPVREDYRERWST